MITKRIALVLGLAALAAPAAVQAQQGPGMRGGMGMMDQPNIAEFIASRTTELQLSEQQVAQITELGRQLREDAEKQMAEMRAAMQGGGMQNMDRQRMMERREAMQKQAEDARAAVLDLLSDEQKAKAAPIIEEWERNRPMRRRDGGRPQQ
jgi:TolA-binding protein